MAMRAFNFKPEAQQKALSNPDPLAVGRRTSLSFISKVKEFVITPRQVDGVAGAD
jgi:hypothetical protein